MFRRREVKQMSLVVSEFSNGLSKFENVYNVVQFPGVAAFYVFKMKVKVNQGSVLLGRLSVLKEVGKLVEKHGIDKVVLFTGSVGLAILLSAKSYCRLS